MGEIVPLQISGERVSERKWVREKKSEMEVVIYSTHPLINRK